MALKTVKFITFEETDRPNVTGENFPTDDWRIFDFPDHYTVIGHRLALGMRSHDIRLCEHEKIIIVFSNYLNENMLSDDIRLSPDGSLCLTIGYSPLRFNALSDAAKEKVLIETACLVFSKLDKSGLYREALATLQADLLEHGEDLEMVYCSKEDQRISVDVSLKIYDTGKCDVFATIKDTDGSLIQRGLLSTAHCFSVALQSCGSILIRKDKIIVKPMHNILTKGLEPIELQYAL